MQSPPPTPGTGQIRAFLDRHFLHFNSREVVAAARAYRAHVDGGGKMLITLAGAMSTAKIGQILARMIRGGFVHAVCCTGANLEEDVFNLLAYNDYTTIPDWRALSAADEKKLYGNGYNRVTDTCIPETVMRHLEQRLLDRWRRACREDKRYFPHEYLWDILGDPSIHEHFQIGTENSWLLAAREMHIPVYTPGWEDSTTGNMFAAAVLRGEVAHHQCVKTGTEQMAHLMQWYCETSGVPGPQAGARKSGVRGQSAASGSQAAEDGKQEAGGRHPPSASRGSSSCNETRTSNLAHSVVGFFQIGGGIAGDFPICAVPALIQDLRREDVPYWAYFAQIGDAPASYGGYSGAVPNEKITWGKLDVHTPKFMIQSDATIVAPLIFAYVMGD